jgi:NDP-sugar pyrophosphorylase family protein
MTTPIVVVLAGGASRRFWPLADKPLLDFGGETLLARHLRLLADAGFQRAVVVAAPETSARVREVCGASRVAAEVIVQTEPRGMADALVRARPALEAAGDPPVYVTQAQDVVEPGLHAAMLAESRRPGAPFALVAASRVRSYFPGGYLSLRDGRLVAIVEKPGAGKEPSDLVNIVAHIFASWRPLAEAVAREVERPGGDDAYERALASLMREREVRPLVYEGRWEPLKHPWHVLGVMEMLLEEWRRSGPPVSGYEQREDGAIIGRDARIYPGAHVVPPAVIGHGAIIGHNALVRGSFVGARCVVGFGSEVARSYLGEGVELHHNYAGDSVLAGGSSMGWGATTANFRLDGRTVPSVVAGERLDTGREKLGLVLGARSRIGVNTSTMPGVKIGAGCVIGANLTINADVPDAARILRQEEHGRG